MLTGSVFETEILKMEEKEGRLLNIEFDHTKYILFSSYQPL